MVRRFLAVIAIVAVIVLPDAQAWGSSGFSNRTLRGNYILEAAGLVANTFGPAQITVLGLVTLNGAGAIAGELTFTSSLLTTIPSPPSSTFQQTCDVHIAEGSAYLVNPDGTATLTAQLATGSGPLTSSGTLNFSSIVINPGVIRIVLSNTPSDLSGLTICAAPGATGNTIRSLVLIGDVSRQHK